MPKWYGQGGCPAGQSCLNNVCVWNYKNSDPVSCPNASWSSCPASQYCSNGTCVGPCSNNTTAIISNYQNAIQQQCYNTCPPGYQSYNLQNCQNTGGLRWQGGNCDNVCYPSVPIMSPGPTGNILPCCGIDTPANFTPLGTCAPGYCPDGPQCGNYFGGLCSTFTDGAWDPNCDTYLSNAANPIGSAQALSQIAQANAQPYSPTTPNPFFGVNAGGTTSYAAQYCSQFPGACDLRPIRTVRLLLEMICTTRTAISIPI